MYQSRSIPCFLPPSVLLFLIFIKCIIVLFADDVFILIILLIIIIIIIIIVFSSCIAQYYISFYALHNILLNKIKWLQQKHYSKPDVQLYCSQSITVYINLGSKALYSIIINQMNESVASVASVCLLSNQNTHIHFSRQVEWTRIFSLCRHSVKILYGAHIFLSDSHQTTLSANTKHAHTRLFLQENQALSRVEIDTSLRSLGSKRGTRNSYSIPVIYTVLQKNSLKEGVTL